MEITSACSKYVLLPKDCFLSWTFVLSTTGKMSIWSELLPVFTMFLYLGWNVLLSKMLVLYTSIPQGISGHNFFLYFHICSYPTEYLFSEGLCYLSLVKNECLGSVYACFSKFSMYWILVIVENVDYVYALLSMNSCQHFFLHFNYFPFCIACFVFTCT